MTYGTRSPFGRWVLSSRSGSDPTSYGSGAGSYLGHTDVANTYWYLEATPVLLRDIAVAGEQLSWEVQHDRGSLPISPRSCGIIFPASVMSARIR